EDGAGSSEPHGIAIEIAHDALGVFDVGHSASFGVELRSCNTYYLPGIVRYRCQKRRQNKTFPSLVRYCVRLLMELSEGSDCTMSFRIGCVGRDYQRSANAGHPGLDRRLGHVVTP
ncbi:hypothetical protein, partial [Aureimonas ureilytica]|uniref:hypothetical protein n=1 Tax=Aureimonas ureilytica TaxID=401562 RepID=UPI001AECECCE